MYGQGEADRQKYQNDWPPAPANGPAIRPAHTSIQWAQVWSLFVPKELAKQLKYIYGVGGQAELKK